VVLAKHQTSPAPGTDIQGSDEKRPLHPGFRQVGFFCLLLSGGVPDGLELTLVGTLGSLAPPELLSADQSENKSVSWKRKGLPLMKCRATATSNPATSPKEQSSPETVFRLCNFPDHDLKCPAQRVSAVGSVAVHHCSPYDAAATFNFLVFATDPLLYRR